MSPTYNFHNTETDEEFSIHLKMVERESYLSENPHLRQIPTMPLIHSGRGIVGKVDDSFRDLLKEMKRENSKGFYRSTVNTDI